MHQTVPYLGSLKQIVLVLVCIILRWYSQYIIWNTLNLWSTLNLSLSLSSSLFLTCRLDPSAPVAVVFFVITENNSGISGKLYVICLSFQSCYCWWLQLRLRWWKWLISWHWNRHRRIELFCSVVKLKLVDYENVQIDNLLFLSFIFIFYWPTHWRLYLISNYFHF